MLKLRSRQAQEVEKGRLAVMLAMSREEIIHAPEIISQQMHGGRSSVPHEEFSNVIEIIPEERALHQPVPSPLTREEIVHDPRSSRRFMNGGQFVSLKSKQLPVA